MKKYILAPVLAMFVLTASAQNNYNISVFNGTHLIKQGNIDARAKTIASVKKYFPGWAVMTDKRSGDITDIYGNAMNISGNNVVAKSVYCMDHMLRDAGIDSKEWKLIKQPNSPKAQYAHYEQYISGHKVAFSKLSFRFTNSGQLQRVNARYYGSKLSSSTPAVSKQQVLNNNTLSTDISGARVSTKKADNDWVWFPVPVNGGYELHPAWHVQVNARVDRNVPLELDGYVDALTGKVLYRTNNVKEAFGVNVKGNVYTQDILTPASLQPLANLEIKIGTGTYYTDNAGSLNVSSLTNVTANFQLKGRWCMVTDDATTVTPSASQALSGVGNNYTFPATAPGSSRHINAYYHVNKVHDFMKGYFPSFTNLDFALEANVDDNSGTCNAFFSGGNTLSFYAPGGGCNSLAEVPDVVYHEYGHAINHNFYDFMGAGFMNNGAMNEAHADIWGLSITQQPKNGRGAFSSGVLGGGCFRRYDRIPKIYPNDIIGEVHADGEIIAGAWWDLGINLGNIADMTQLFTEVYYDTPDGPDGSEGQVYHDVLVSALMNDDIDANLANGTPHFTQIVSAFARHGINLLGDVYINHDEVPHAEANKAVNITADISVLDPTFFQNAQLHYRVHGTATWTDVPMINSSGTKYTGVIPAQTATTLVDYYITTHTILSAQNGSAPGSINYASMAPELNNLPYQFGVGIKAVDSNQFEATAGTWSIGNGVTDNAVTGIWTQDIPIPSFLVANNDICQTGGDHTSGSGKCLVTGNAASSSSDVGQNDVDNGLTTVRTPSFDLSSYTTPVIEYYRWYTDNKGGGINAGNDPWVVQVGDGTGSGWVYVDSTYQSDARWRRRIFAVKEYMSITSSVVLRFMANDAIDDSCRNQGGSLLEAAVDDFFIYDIAPVAVGETPVAVKAQVYPNPADDRVYVQLSQAAKGSISLSDVTGRVIAKQDINTTSVKYEFNTAQLAAGMYTLLIQTKHSVQSSKLVVGHK